MPERFIFRQVDYRDIATFLNDGEIRAHNHQYMQRCHQTSDPNINRRRGNPIYNMPNDYVVHDYVAFYFSPFTSFTCSIHRGGVEVYDPNGLHLEKSQLENRVFIVCKISAIFDVEIHCCFSNLALNSLASIPEIIEDQNQLETHVNWHLFDENWITASIPEIGYNGVCKFFGDMATPVKYQNRKHQRMAEFLVHNSLSLDQVSCIVTPNDAKKDLIQTQMDASAWNIPVHTKSGCFVR